MDKLKMHSLNKVDDNIKKIGALFPNCITERKNADGEVEYAIDFDVLKQELSSVVVEGNEERYQFTWPDKKKSILLANAPIAKTLRPCREESVDFDNTENLYIEGDNLDVLKLLQETYLGKIKMIYIDPPYNTGNDFVYNDDFAESADEYLANSGQFDEEGNRLVANTESNGRFHTDWLNMIYTRIKLSKDLLSNDGLIFISIDDCEQVNLRKICDEIFGKNNFVTEFVWKCRNSLQHDEPLVSKQTERILFYVKNRSLWSSETGWRLNRIRKPFDATEYKNPDNDPRGPWLSSGKTRNDGRASYTVTSPAGVQFTKPWIPSPSEFKRWEEEGLIWWGKDGKSIPRKKSFLKDFKGNAISDILFDEYTDEIKGENIVKRTKRWEIGTTESGTKGEKVLFDGKAPFDYPKPWTLIKYFAQIATNAEDIILDFFSGSSTTAHAVMQLNAEDGGNRKFIMVQLPEETDKKSEAYKAGYKNICEIGKERIRRAGAKIQQDRVEEIETAKHEWDQTSYYVDHKEECDKLGHLPDEFFDTHHPEIDTGVRVLKLDSTNMKDVYYNPADYELSLFDDLSDNIKEDRTPEDLLFQVMLDLGVLLSSKIEESIIGGKKVFNVADGFLYACFDENVSEDVITEIAKKQPYYFVMRDSSMASDSVATNFEQIFATYSPDTVRKVL